MLTYAVPAYVSIRRYRYRVHYARGPFESIEYTTVGAPRVHYARHAHYARVHYARRVH